MDISKFTVEDFVYDPSFRKWVLAPDIASIALWDDFLENPAQRTKAAKAREILLRIESGRDKMTDFEFDEVWGNVDSAIRALGDKKTEGKIIPIHPGVETKPRQKRENGDRKVSQFNRIAAILVVIFGLGLLAAIFLKTEPLSVAPNPVVFEEHTAPPGIKSFLTLSDGSQVTLNSGSTMRYIRGFDTDKREVFLEGEAYFDVFKDEQRPFVVKNADVSVTALGTSFNVKAYEEERLDISLVSGKVGVDFNGDEAEYIVLEKGEGLHIEPSSGTWDKAPFNEDEVLGWTKKMIIFNKTPVSEAIRILENWYGITIQFENEPPPSLLLSGRFENETLKNVLEGLSYTTQLEFELENNTVKIKF